MQDTPKRMQDHHLIKSECSSHNTTLRLLALIQISFLLPVPNYGVLLSYHALDFDSMLTLHMPPFESLNHVAIYIICADGPFPS